MVQTRTLFLIVWTGGRSHRVTEWTPESPFDGQLKCPGAHVCLEHRPAHMVWTFLSNMHFLSLSPSFAHSRPFSLELGSCRASEKGGDFLLDKHVINLREHILSHRKITEGENLQRCNTGGSFRLLWFWKAPTRAEQSVLSRIQQRSRLCSRLVCWITSLFKLQCCSPTRTSHYKKMNPPVSSVADGKSRFNLRSRNVKGEKVPFKTALLMICWYSCWTSISVSIGGLMRHRWGCS